MMTDLDRAAAILRERARLLARPLAAASEPAVAEQTMLRFRVGTARYALAMSWVVEVYRAAAVTPVPRAVAPVVGAAAWRGRALAVLGAPSAATTARPWLVVIGGARRAACALFVDEPEDTVSLGSGDVHPAPARAGALPVTGVTGDAVLVLDGGALVRRFDAEQQD